MMCIAKDRLLLFRDDGLPDFTTWKNTDFLRASHSVRVVTTHTKALLWRSPFASNHHQSTFCLCLWLCRVLVSRD